MSGRLRVRVASAGTGKTTVLVARYLELIGQGVPLRRIAGATFTRASAEELKQRVAGGISELLREGSYLGLVTLKPEQEPAFRQAERELSGALLSTISGLMVRFLRLVAPSIGLDPEFSMMDEHDASNLFEEEFRSQYLVNGRDHDARELELALTLFSKRSLVAAFSEGDGQARELLQQYEAAMAAYSQRLASRLMGPADVERHALRLLELPAALTRIGQRHTHILLDEFQDVNPLQGAFFRALADSGIVVEAVGDPKQSIYAFRDADVEVFRQALREGERLPDLSETRRHSRGLTRFLNHATSTMGEHDLGFSTAEAPEVTPAGSQAEVEGSVEVHWVKGRASIELLRNQEARLLAELLTGAHADGTAWDDMAVLAGTHASLGIAHRALLAAGIPAVMGRGSGFFQRQEVRDVAAALKTGVSASGPAFAAWLRSPFVQLDLDELQEVLRAPDRLEALMAIDARIPAALMRLRELVLLPPLQALTGVLREPLARGRPIGDWLSSRQRANLDALLLRSARRPPADLELLLAEIDRHAHSKIGEVPESGGGVSLVTVHYAKGLEWPLAAVFDCGRAQFARGAGLFVRQGDGAVALPGSALFEELAEAHKAREVQEHYRQFYVAVSRPRNRLILTGSIKGESPRGWARLLDTMGLGADVEGAAPAGVRVSTYGLKKEAARPLPERHREVPVRAEAPWTGLAWEHGRFQPVMSPSSLHVAPAADSAAEAAPEEEPLAQAGTLQETDTVVTRAAAIGTLLHAGIALDWKPDDGQLEEDLLAQEVMFSFSQPERLEIVRQVIGLLGRYQGMLGRELKALAERQDDEAELPLVLPFAGTVWQGTIDRLYRAGDEWYLDDYKTDGTVQPDRYLGQLAIYSRAAREMLGCYPRVRLVWLRHDTVTEVPAAELQATLELLEAGEAL